MADSLTILTQLLPIEFLNTCIMVFGSTIAAALIALPLGIFLWWTSPGGFIPKKGIYQSVSMAITIGRSIPFAILMIAIIPFTRFIVGTSLGPIASIVPLTLAAIPMAARLVENSLKSIPKERLEAAQVMGATYLQTTFAAALPEAITPLLRGLSLLMINLVGYSAMAGLIGGGGLGKVAMIYGYQRFNGTVMFWTLIVIVLLVEVIEKCIQAVIWQIEKKRGVYQ